VSHADDVCAFFRHYSIFFRVPLNVLVRTPGGTRTPGWEPLMIRENQRTGEETCPSATFSTINPTRTSLGWNLRLRIQKPSSHAGLFTTL